MIIFDLLCDFQHEFEGWFKHSEDLNQQLNNGLLTCPVCGSEHVSKRLSAPKIAKRILAKKVEECKSSKSYSIDQTSLNRASDVVNSSNSVTSKEAFSQLQTMFKKIHDHVETNFENVGYGFAKQALRMHKGDEEPSNIYGKATPKQVKELREEGVTAVPLPMKPVEKDKLN